MSFLPQLNSQPQLMLMLQAILWVQAVGRRRKSPGLSQPLQLPLWLTLYFPGRPLLQMHLLVHMQMHLLVHMQAVVAALDLHRLKLCRSCCKRMRMQASAAGLHRCTAPCSHCPSRFQLRFRCCHRQVSRLRTHQHQDQAFLQCPCSIMAMLPAVLGFREWWHSRRCRGSHQVR